MGDIANVYFFKQYVAIMVPLDCSEMEQGEKDNQDFLFGLAEQMAKLDGLDVSGCEASIVWP
jgi:hypothetical protein